jgi:hypothetical protein
VCPRRHTAAYRGAAPIDDTEISVRHESDRTAASAYLSVQQKFRRDSQPSTSALRRLRKPKTHQDFMAVKFGGVHTSLVGCTPQSE